MVLSQPEEDQLINSKKSSRSTRAQASPCPASPRLASPRLASPRPHTPAHICKH